jgi:prepilin-type N-terminal cleavage/methylation domain-containing protein
MEMKTQPFRAQRRTLALVWGAHAPSRAGFGASPKHSRREKSAIAGARSPAREARALPRQERAFTLIELLVVIVIIAILAGVAFPVFSSIQNQAKKTQAKNDVTQIVTAVNAFYTEYGRYPTAATSDTAAVYGPGKPKTDVIFNELRNKGTMTFNSRQIVFISPAEDATQSNPKGKIGSDGQFYDPWGSAYSIAIDADYDNQVLNPYTGTGGAGPDPIRQGVIAWSLGKNGALGGGAAGAGFADESGTAGTYTGSGDVISWQ